LSFKKNISNIRNVWNVGNNISEPNKPLPSTFKIVNQIANFFSPGDFFYYIVNFETMQFEFVSDSVKDVLGIEPHEMSLDKFLSFYHPDDLEKMAEKEKAALEFKINRINPSEITDYKTVYLIRYLLPDGSIKKILHQAKAINISKNGKIQQVLGVHADVTYLNAPIDHKISFIGDTLPSYYALDPNNLVLDEVKTKNKFTPQELKILQLISQGKSNLEISQKLFVAENTVKTHRKNILKKSNSINTPHLIANCIREGLI